MHVTVLFWCLARVNVLVLGHVRRRSIHACHMASSESAALFWCLARVHVLVLGH
jgi:hypothetical protein